MAKPGKPKNEKEIARIISACARDGRGVEITGGGTKRGLGHPVAASEQLDLSGLSGIVLYEPESLTLIAKAGTRLSEIKKALAKEGQMLPFEPPSLGGLYGSSGKATIGGTIACGLSGSRRIQAGAARDSLIGVRFVSGNGDIVKNGGRVMKNVTGYDLTKLMCGSHGTLGVLTELSFKLLPEPAMTANLLLKGLNDSEAIAALLSALNSPYGVTGAAHISGNEEAITLIRVEGFENSVEYRCDRLTDMLQMIAPVDREAGDVAKNRWRKICEVEPVAQGEGQIWRLSVKPSDGPAIVARLRSRLDLEAIYDWGGGLIWIRTEGDINDSVAGVRDEISRTNGHATLMRATDEEKEDIEVFQAEVPELQQISDGLRQQFDPHGILNPGRMTGKRSIYQNQEGLSV